jgi:hypothetical protein
MPRPSRTGAILPKPKAVVSRKKTPVQPAQRILSEDVLAELIRRIKDIELGYRLVAQRMGQLYIYADQHDMSALTRSLDKPMRNASDNERALAAILDDLQVTADPSHQRTN